MAGIEGSMLIEDEQLDRLVASKKAFYNFDYE